MVNLHGHTDLEVLPTITMPCLHVRSSDLFVRSRSQRVSNTHKFTGKEHDNETGLENFLARYDSSSMGRFISPDDVFSDTTVSDPQSWNLYAFIRNNPMRFTDPTGEMVYVGGLSQSDLDALLQRIDATYGCAACASVDGSGYLEVDTEGLSDQIRAATQYLTDAIRSQSYFAKVQTDGNRDVAFGETHPGATDVMWHGRRTNADLILLDFGDDKWVGGDKDAAKAFLDTVFAHEVAHVFGNPQVGLQYDPPRAAGSTGPVVDQVNAITDALGLPRRTAYLSSPFGGYWVQLPFAKTEVGKNGQPHQKQVYLNWLKQQVGGKGVN